MGRELILRSLERHRQVLALCLILLGTATAAFSKDWTFLYKKDGIEVFTDDGMPPTYRAEGVLDVDIVDIIAVFSDVPRRTEWVRYLGESRVITENHVDKVWVYSRYRLPWPANDRDSLIETRYTKDFKTGELTVRFNTIEVNGEPPRKGIVRVPKADGTLSLKVLGPGKTFVRYEVNLDQGGWLPLWICNHFIRDAPLQMLQAMRRRIIEKKEFYRGFRDSEWALWHGQIPPVPA